MLPDASSVLLPPPPLLPRGAPPLPPYWPSYTPPGHGATAWCRRRCCLAPSTPPLGATNTAVPWLRLLGLGFATCPASPSNGAPPTPSSRLCQPDVSPPPCCRRRPESEPIAGHVPPRQGTDQQPHYHGTARRGHTSPTSITRCMYFISARPLCCFLLLRFDKHFLLVELIYTNGSVDF
ncbi:atherin-like isoform X1 [Panicum virgatum]|uniref:atherin-like isoform X1 n=1 Tax=Panicum virgatum TaxID=38727 RepID=UPI0019D51991|nr:atherin-like isoform X1 [Panicum virgatum]